MIVILLDELRSEGAHGVRTYLFELRKQISRSKKITVIQTWLNSNTTLDFRKEVINGIITLFIPANKGQYNSNYEYEAAIADYLTKQIPTKKDIVFQFNWINHCGLSHQLKKNLKCKIILVKHWSPWRNLITANYELFFKLNNFYNKKPRLSFPITHLSSEQVFYQAVDHIICVSEAEQKSLENVLCYPIEKTTVVHNGLNYRHQREGRKILRMKYGIKDDEKIILFVGSIIERKGVVDVIKAFNILIKENPFQNFRLIIIGGGDHNILFRNIQNSWTKITLTGNLDQKHVYEFYQIADVGVVPSYVEPFGYTALEMALMNIPLIVADVDGLREIVPSDCSFRLKINIGKKGAKINTTHLKEMLLKYLSDTKLADEYSAKAKDYVSKHFSAKKMADSTINVYTSLFDDSSLKKKEMSLISVIVIFHNALETIVSTIESVLKQTWNRFELIIIDDCSNDKSSKVLDTFDDPRIIKLKNRVRKGKTYCMNLAVKLATGKYIAWLSQDSEMHEQRLEKQILFLERNEEIDCVGSWVFIKNSNKEVIACKEYPLKDEEIKILLPFKQTFQQTALTVRSSIQKKIKFRKSLTEADSPYYWNSHLTKIKIYNLPECLTYVYNRSIVKLSQKDSSNQSLLELQCELLEEMNLDPSLVELKLHAAIVTGKSRVNSYWKENEHLFLKWIETVLNRSQEKFSIPYKTTQAIKTYILSDIRTIGPGN